MNPMTSNGKQRFALVANVLSILVSGLALAMVPSVVISYFDQAPDRDGLWISCFCLGVLGLFTYTVTRSVAREITLGHREGFIIVGLGWLVAGLAGAMPFYLYAHLSPVDLCSIEALTAARLPPIGSDFCLFSNAMFESVSGITTTGATIVSDGLWVSSDGLTTGGRVGLPRGILLWRATLHMMGGMGIVVLGVAILPLLGVGGMQLFKAEVPGPQAGKLAPRIGETAKLLWTLYILLIIVLMVLLALGGMSLFEAVCHSFTTVSTGGFSTRAESVGGFDSAYIEWVIIVFMVIGGANFALHFAALRGDWRSYLKDPEWWAYVALILIGTGLVTLSIYTVFSDLGFTDAVRTALFQVLSILTTTGLVSHDYEAWAAAPLAMFVLMLLMLSGGMSGSTSGGVKIVRHLLLFRSWVRELFFLSHPRGVRPIRLGGRVVPSNVMRSISAFMAAYISFLVIGTLIFAFDGADLLTAFSASAATLGNVGPGWGDIGPMDHYQHFSDSSKYVACFFMTMGRLELFTVLVLLSPAFWRR